MFCRLHCHETLVCLGTKCIKLCCLDNPVVFIVDYEYVQSIIFNSYSTHPPQPEPLNIHSSFLDMGIHVHCNGHLMEICGHTSV